MKGITLIKGDSTEIIFEHSDLLEGYDVFLKAYLIKSLEIRGESYVLELSSSTWLAEFQIPHRSMESSISFRDLTRKSGENSLIATQSTYFITGTDAEEKIALAKSRAFCLALAQSYEQFETFIIDCFAKYYHSKRAHYELFHLVKLPVDFDGMRYFIKRRFKERELFMDLLKKESVLYRTYHANNLYTYNLWTMFDVLLKTRHIITHSYLKPTQEFISLIQTSGYKEVFDEIYELKEVGGEKILFTTHLKCSRGQEFLQSLAYFIVQCMKEIDT